LKAIDEGLTEELDKSIKKPIEIVNLIFNYYVGDGGAEFVSGSEHVIKEVMLCARYTSPPLRQMRSPLYTNFFVSYCHPPF
jgi:hypothetical protein